MNITVPVYIEQTWRENELGPYAIRPLFSNEPQQSDVRLSQAMSKMARDLRRKLFRLGCEPRHDELAEWAFCPELDCRRLELALQLRKRTAKCQFLFASFTGLGRRLAFTPSIPELWFEIQKGQTLRDRATEVLSEHFRKQEKEFGPEAAKPEEIAPRGKVWMDYIELDIQPVQTISPPLRGPQLAAIFSGERLSGAEELDRCGRCVNWLFPDELNRALLRDQEVAELRGLLAAPDKRPVLLVGPSKVGKTAIVHEYVYQVVEKRGRSYKTRENVWLLSPQRLVSGMSYVGQWENRLLAIIKEARQRKHILYFDDLPGLYQAGITRDCSLSIAQVLKPYVERREFRLLAEITPESLRVLQEQDRAFADLFHVLPVKEPAERENLRILIHVMRRLEGRRRCCFAADALPTVLDIQRRYAGNLAFPGKAAGFLSQLAAKYTHGEVSRQTVLQEFRAKSGLSASFADDRAKLSREEVVTALCEEVIGQDEAVAAMADAVCVAKARLNDPERPLGTFLFLGPTGVGKTQCAKSLARYLFGTEDKLVRFDMNEFVSESSVPRLVGTFGDPEGLLTSAVARQPFSVVLFDEIEKAHPGVFDLLLQVLGEGHLTNALGQTTDFTNTIVIMTSNLGVRQADARFGFGAGDRARDDVFIRAAKDYFRPEFFNRIDRIVPFQQLGRDDIRQIATKLLAEFFEREGLQRRKCVLRVEPAAMDLIIDAGYHPRLGARALKRAMERELTQPVAARLAAMQPKTAVVVHIYPSAGGIIPVTQELINAERKPLPEDIIDTSDHKVVIERARAVVARVEAGLPDFGFKEGIPAVKLTAEHYRYLGIKEQMGGLRLQCRRIMQRIEYRRPPNVRTDALPHAWRRTRAKPRTIRKWWKRDLRFWGALWTAEDVHEYFAELTDRSEPYGEGLHGSLADLIRGLCWLHVVAETRNQPDADRCLMHVRSIAGVQPEQRWNLQTICWNYFGAPIGETSSILYEKARGAGIVGDDSYVFLVEGPGVSVEAGVEEGTHLFFPSHGNIIPIQVSAIPLRPEADPLEALASQMEQRKRWLDRLARGEVAPEDDPQWLGPVIRLYEEDGVTVDCRTGLLSTKERRTNLSVFVYSQLPVPPELLE